MKVVLLRLIETIMSFISLLMETSSVFHTGTFELFPRYLIILRETCFTAMVAPLALRFQISIMDPKKSLVYPVDTFLAVLAFLLYLIGAGISIFTWSQFDFVTGIYDGWSKFKLLSQQSTAGILSCTLMYDAYRTMKNKDKLADEETKIGKTSKAPIAKTGKKGKTEAVESQKTKDARREKRAEAPIEEDKPRRETVKSLRSDEEYKPLKDKKDKPEKDEKSEKSRRTKDVKRERAKTPMDEDKPRRVTIRIEEPVKEVDSKRPTKPPYLQRWSTKAASPPPAVPPPPVAKPYFERWGRKPSLAPPVVKEEEPKPPPPPVEVEEIEPVVKPRKKKRKKRPPEEGELRGSRPSLSQQPYQADSPPPTLHRKFTKFSQDFKRMVSMDRPFQKKYEPLAKLMRSLERLPASKRKAENLETNPTPEASNKTYANQPLPSSSRPDKPDATYQRRPKLNR